MKQKSCKIEATTRGEEEESQSDKRVEEEKGIAPSLISSPLGMGLKKLGLV